MNDTDEPTKTMIRVWCEWDVGQDGLIFTNKTAAQEWIEDNDQLKELAREDAMDGPIEFIAVGLVGYHHVVVIEPKAQP